MLSKHTPYFAQTEKGESRLPFWLIGFWFTIVAWVVGQNVLVSPIPNLVKDSHPDVYTAYQDTAVSMIENIPAFGAGMYASAAGVAILLLLSLLFLLLNSEKKHRLILGLTLAGVGLLSSFVFFVNYRLFSTVKEAGMMDKVVGNTDFQTGALFPVMLLTVVLTIIFWTVNRNSGGKLRRNTGLLTGLYCALSVIAAFITFPRLSDPEFASLVGSMMGLHPMAYALMLATFPALLIGLFLVQKFIHKRSITSLHTSAQNFDFKRVIYAIAITWAVLGSITLVMHVTGLSPVRYQLEPARFFTYALVTLIFIPLQSGTEEIVFRGYLNQGIGHFISNKWVVFFITSAMFASMHLANPEAQAGAEKGALTHLLVMSHYFMFGFILSVIVYFEDGLEAAIGLHAGNNMFAAMFVNYEGSALPTPSAFITGINPDIDIPVGILSIALIAWILYRSRANKELTLA